MEPDITPTPSTPLADASGRLLNEPPAIAAFDPHGFAAQARAGKPSGPTAAPTGHAPASAPGRAFPIPHINGHPHPADNGATAAWRLVAGAAVTTGREVPVPSVVALPARPGFYLRVGKRLLDVAGSLIALVLSAPVVALAAIAIKLESRGPVLYRSTRIGQGGRPFTFYKLRSMVNGADRHRHHLSHLNECDGPVFKISHDPRVTAVGRLLRTTSLDELPQLWNVLRGDMSLVGPRPPLPDEVSHYQPWQRRRLDVRPGLTCLWQISGRSRIGFEEWMRMDLEYIRRQSFALDLQILLRTIPAVLSREGAY